MRPATLIAFAVLIGCWTPAARADVWPQLRGPQASAVSTATQTPLEWSADKNVVWKVHLAGYGWSSPIVWGDKVFVTTAVSDKQRKPAPGFAGPPRRGGARHGDLLPAQVLSSFLQDMLNLTEEQQSRLKEAQKEIDGKLAGILKDEQKKVLNEPPTPGPEGMRNIPAPGQLVSAPVLERLKLSAEQKKQMEALQKDVDAHLDRLLTAEQKKQMEQMRQVFRRMMRGESPSGFSGGKPPDAVYRWEVYCLDRRTGKVLWKQLARESKPSIPTQASNTYASETPITDGERVYAYFGMHGVYCYDLEGNRVWKVDLGSYPMAMGFGTGASPALADGRLFIQCDNEKQSFLVALDARTGKELWRVERPERSGYSTPFIWKNRVRTEVVCLGSPHVRSYDPATGKQLWQLGGMSGQAKASPVADAELLYVGTGGGPGGRGRRGPGGERGGWNAGSRPLFAVKAGASGDITLPEDAESSDGVAWRVANGGPQTASPLLYEGYLYVLDEHGGLVSCYEAKTGKRMYKERLPQARGFTSSPWAAAGKVFLLDDGGTTYVIQAGPQFKVLGRNRIEEMCWATPALADGALFLRTVDHLYCIRQKDSDQ